MTAIPGHRHEAAAVIAIPLRVGIRLQQDLHRLEMSSAYGEVDRGRVPVFTARQAPVALDQPAQSRTIAPFGTGYRGPDVRLYVVGFDHALRISGRRCGCPDQRFFGTNAWRMSAGSRPGVAPLSVANRYKDAT